MVEIRMGLTIDDSRFTDCRLLQNNCQSSDLFSCEHKRHIMAVFY